eukprot:CAMPEP_0195298450 /NCGR_PEP_ID=MMETSP0707-20130614/23497_1 /TAXON_ID=33640 /ORGANISM="Asterionellopsis glacialis, Strain CCMP134" /LENGTH=297 /DNA_ID=CAMNT_0040360567 /DNA_START=189 /DNA_END=1082 /DNA_ORIENTATION=-
MTSSIQVPDDAKIKLSGVCGNTRPTTRSSFWKTTTTTTTTLSSAVVAFGDGTLLTKVWKTTSPLLQMIGEELHNLTPIQRIILVVTFVAGCQVGKTRPFWKRMTNVMDIPSNYFGPKAPILRGRAVSVTDGDTIRFLHVPTFFHPTSIRTSQKEKVSSVAMPIRLCTYDTPETAKFGKPGQPFGEEAKSHLQELLSPPTTTKSGRGRVIKVRLLQKDQYGRAVAQVFTGRWPFRRYIDEQMLQVGLAEVYQGMGAVYGPKGKEEYLRMEKQARDHKRGIWSQTERESAAAYKKRTKK